MEPREREPRVFLNQIHGRDQRHDQKQPKCDHGTMPMMLQLRHSNLRKLVEKVVKETKPNHFTNSICLTNTLQILFEVEHADKAGLCADADQPISDYDGRHAQSCSSHRVQGL